MSDGDGSGGAGEEYRRREVLGGLSGLLAAAAFSRPVAADAAVVRDDDAGATRAVTSPDGSIEVRVDVDDGVPAYALAVDGTRRIERSPLGFDFAGQPTFGLGADGSTGAPVTVTGTERTRERETWEPVWGQHGRVSAPYVSLRVGLAETDDPGRTGTLEVRLFDDGLGFRFVFGESFGTGGGEGRDGDGSGDDGGNGSGGGRFAVASENTTFAFADDYRSWWIANRFTNPRFEQEYTESPLSGLPSGVESRRPNGNRVRNGAHTPLTVDAGDVYLAVHEADLTDYATMSVAPTDDPTTLRAELAPLPDGTRVAATAPHVTPWRTVGVGRAPTDLAASSLVPLLNRPLDEAAFPTDAAGEPDLSWITPQKYLGIWWLMIAGSANWQYRTDDEVRAIGQDPRRYIHGAQTDRMRRYLNFASANGVESVLVEGWNEGWRSYPGDGDAFDFDRSYPDFDLEAVTDYGRRLDPAAEVTIHNETGGNVVNYERQVEAGVYDVYESLGIRSIKSGYVADDGLGFEGDGTAASHNHHCQLAVNHQTLVARAAAADRQMLEVHEGIKPTGRRRTYPNLTTREVVRGQEYDGFGDLGSFVSPEHHVTLPFTRLLAGPASYTPGIFDVTFTDTQPGRIESTRAKQLAMYPTYFSGLQMVADRMEAYLDPGLSVGEVLHARAGENDGFVVADTWRNALGAHYVAADRNRVPTGSTLTWTVRDVERAGTYDLHVRYASSGTENADPVLAEGTRATLRVNGEPYDGDAGTISPPFTPDWDRWETVVVPVDLAAGDNEVTLALAEGDRGGFNLDSVAVTPPGEPRPEPPAAENVGTLPEFDFVEAVPAAWDDTRFLDGAIGDYVVTARRSGREWFVGAMTDESGRALDVPLGFLSPGDGQRGPDGDGPPGREGDDGREDGGPGRAPRGPRYVAEIYSDAAEGAREATGDPVRIDRALVDPSTTLLASTVESGGTAVRLRPARGRETADLPTYERPEQVIDATIRAEPFVGEPFVSATGSNPGDYVGGTEVAVAVDGSVVARTNVRLAPGATDETVSFDYAIDEPGTYAVEVRRVDGDTIAARTVTVRPPATVADLTDPTGDDVGPGGYVYPTDGAFRDGAFDVERFEVTRTPSLQRFEFEVATLYDAFGGRFSPHMFLVWVRDPSLSGGSTTSLDDLNATVDFEAPWQYRLRVDGFNLDAVDASGDPLLGPDGGPVSPSVAVDFDAGTVALGLDRAVFGVDAADLEVVAAVGSENFGALRPVAVEPGPFTFGGAVPGAVENAPRLVDVVTPEGVDQADALAYDADSRATLPFVPL